MDKIDKAIRKKLKTTNRKRSDKANSVIIGTILFILYDFYQNGFKINLSFYIISLLAVLLILIFFKPSHNIKLFENLVFKLKNENVFEEKILNDIENSKIFSSLILSCNYIIFEFEDNIKIFPYDEILWCYIKKVRYYSRRPKIKYSLCIVDLKGNIYETFLNNDSLYKEVLIEIEKRCNKIYIGYDRNLEIKVKNNIDEVYLIDKSDIDKQCEKFESI